MLKLRPVHGPYGDLSTDAKSRTMRRIKNGRCRCGQCEQRDQPKRMPKPPVWSSHPGEPGETWLCQGPSVAPAFEQEEPWQ